MRDLFIDDINNLLFLDENPFQSKEVENELIKV
jgi:hypothetical protein